MRHTMPHLLIVLKAVRSATVLVGDDTDLIVLLCCHASMTSSFVLSQSKCLGQTFATTSSLFMRFLGVTQHLASMGLEKELPSKDSEQVTHFVSRPRCLIHIQLPYMMW